MTELLEAWDLLSQARLSPEDNCWGGQALKVKAGEGEDGPTFFVHSSPLCKLLECKALAWLLSTLPRALCAGMDGSGFVLKSRI